jgi:protein TonB
MVSDPLAPPVVPPEWRHIGPYLLAALALHALALAMPRRPPPIATPEPPPVVTVSFAHPLPPAAAPAPVPVEPPADAVRSASPERTRQKEAAVRRIVTAASLAADVAVTFSVPDAGGHAPGPAAAPPAPAAVISARFDAAYLNNPRPAYPAASRRLGEEGRVVLRVAVSSDGRPVAVDVERSSNFERLDEAARQAVVRWRFLPARRGNEAVDSAVLVPLVFRLDD